METSRVLEVIRRHAYQLFLTIALLSCMGCVSMLRIDGPYEGRVIDAGTNQPIEGAVVHGTWYKVEPTPAGRSSTYYNSTEMLTDRNGEFKIPGQGLLVFSKIDGMHLTIFKAGYEGLAPSIWRGLKKWKINDKITWDGDKGTIKLKRMTLEERRKRLISTPVGVPDKKEKLLRKECNRENIEIGRPKSTLYPEE